MYYQKKNPKKYFCRRADNASCSNTNTTMHAIRKCSSNISACMNVITHSYEIYSRVNCWRHNILSFSLSLSIHPFLLSTQGVQNQEWKSSISSIMEITLYMSYFIRHGEGKVPFKIMAPQSMMWRLLGVKIYIYITTMLFYFLIKDTSNNSILISL